MADISLGTTPAGTCPQCAGPVEPAVSIRSGLFAHQRSLSGGTLVWDWSHHAPGRTEGVRSAWCCRNPTCGTGFWLITAKARA